MSLTTSPNLYSLSLHDALPISHLGLAFGSAPIVYAIGGKEYVAAAIGGSAVSASLHLGHVGAVVVAFTHRSDRKSTRLNSSHQIISYAVFCLKKKDYHRQSLTP